MKYQIPATIHKEGKWYVALAVGLGVASQGKTVQQAENNLVEAVELYLEDQDPDTVFQITEKPLFTFIKASGGKKTAFR